MCCVAVDTTPASPLYIKREATDHKALLHGILSQHHAAALLNYNHSNTGQSPHTRGTV